MCWNCKGACSCPDGTPLAKCACSMNIYCDSCGHHPRPGSEKAEETAK